MYTSNMLKLCFPDTKYKQDPNQAAKKSVLRPQVTPRGTYLKLFELHYEALKKKYDRKW